MLGSWGRKLERQYRSPPDPMAFLFTRCTYPPHIQQYHFLVVQNELFQRMLLYSQSYIYNRDQCKREKEVYLANVLRYGSEVFPLYKTTIVYIACWKNHIKNIKIIMVKLLKSHLKYEPNTCTIVILYVKYDMLKKLWNFMW